MGHEDELVIRFLDGKARGPDEQDLREWRAASPANDARYREWERVWARTEPLLAELQAVDPPEIADLLAGSGAPATAAAKASRARRAHVGWAAVVAAVSVVGYGIGRLSGRPGIPHAGAELVTGADERVTVELEDGSIVRLGPDSRLRIPAGPAGREVWLDGRAFFAIAERDGRPFRVRTRMGEALVLGTRFELQVRDRALRLVVVEGRVALETGDRSVKLEAGEEGRVLDGRAVEVTSADDVLPRLDWAGDFLAFTQTPLSQVAIEVAGRFDAEVVIADSALSSRTVSGWYVGTDFHQTMEAICLVIGAHCMVAGDTAVIEP